MRPPTVPGTTAFSPSFDCRPMGTGSKPPRWELKSFPVRSLNAPVVASPGRAGLHPDALARRAADAEATGGHVGGDLRLEGDEVARAGRQAPDLRPVEHEEVVAAVVAANEQGRLRFQRFRQRPVAGVQPVDFLVGRRIREIRHEPQRAAPEVERACRAVRAIARQVRQVAGATRQQAHGDEGLLRADREAPPPGAIAERAPEFRRAAGLQLGGRVGPGRSRRNPEGHRTCPRGFRHRPCPRW